MIRDIDGNIVPFGKVERKLEECFLGSALPAWLTVTGTGSGSIVLPHVDYGYYQLTTGETVNNLVTLNILPTGIDMTKFKEIKLDIDALVFGSNEETVDFFVGMIDSAVDRGFTIQHLFTGTVGYAFDVRTRHTTGDTVQEINYDLMANGDWQRRRNLTIRLRSDSTISLAENDSVFWEKTIPSTEMLLNGVLLPTISLRTRTAGAKYVRFSRIALTLIHN